MKRLKKLFLSLFFLLALLPSVVKASNNVLETQYNYSIIPNGAGVYHFKIVAFSRAFYNHWLSEDKEKLSSLCVIGKDGKEKTIATFSGSNQSDVKKGDTRNFPFTPCDGTFIIDGNTYTSDKGTVNVKSTKASLVDDQPTLFIEGDWVPDLTRFGSGEMITFVLHIKDDCHGSLREHDFEWGPYSHNSACTAPVLMEPFIDLDKVSPEDQGGMRILWSSSRNLIKYTVVVTEGDSTTEKIFNISQPGLPNGEFLLEPSNQLRKVHIKGEMYADDQQSVKVTILSNEVTVKPYMSISSFNVEKTYEKEKAGNKMKFTWEIDNPSLNDYMPSDMFVLQRAYFPDFSDAVTINSVPVLSPTRYVGEKKNDENGDTIYNYDKAIFEYEVDDIRNTYNIYKDTTGTRNIFDNNSINKYSKLRPYISVPNKKVYYRLQRSIASSIWDDNISKRYRKDTAISLNYKLPAITELTVKKADNWESSRKADVEIKLANYWFYDTPGYINVLGSSDKKDVIDLPNIRLYNWDTNANIVLCRISQETGDTVKTIIKGSEVKLSKDSTCYYVNTTTETPEAFTHTSFVAYVDDANSVYSVYPTQKFTESVSVADSFFYEDCASIERFTASTNVKGGIQLNWKATSGPISYYTLHKRLGTCTGDSGWEDMKIDSLQTEVFDQDKQDPEKEFEYKLTLVYEYYGKKFEKTYKTKGRAYPFYSIAGRVKTVSDNGIGNIRVKATNNITKDSVFALTNADGTYAFDSLAFENGAIYTVEVISRNGNYDANNGGPSYEYSFNYQKTYYTGADFTCTNAHNFSGRVLYSNSTIPVRGAHFKINGEVLYANGKILKTDNNGNFSFDLPESNVSVQVVKEGHKFHNDGFIHATNDTSKSFVPTTDYKKLELQDETRITLAGRIAGSDEQGAFPLGFNLSENILGDSITMVLELEGDNTAQIVYKKENPNDTEIDTFFVHHNNKEQTDSVGVTGVKYQRKRIVIYPDQQSGEFFVDLPPVKYKMTKLYAQGYSTLFNNGEAAQIIDLSADSLTQSKTYTHVVSEKKTLHTTYNAEFSRIYHAPIQLTYKQLNNAISDNMLGEEQLSFSNIYGEWVDYKLAAFNDSTKKLSYTFKHPVFNEGSTYLLQISANEEYVYNGNDSSRIKHVAVPNLTLNINNGLTTDKKTFSVTMDAKGTYLLKFKANNPTFSLTEEDALRHLELSVEKDGYGYKANSIDAFVTGTRYKGTDVFAAKEIDVTLFDILRDPPGSGSSAYMESGAKYTYSRKWNKYASIGLNIGYKNGGNYSNYIGSWAGTQTGTLLATQSKGSINSEYSIDIPIFNYNFGNGNATYNFTINDRIETSSGKYDVGAMYDLYIGATTDITAQKMDVLSLIDYKTYKAVTFAINQGAIKVIAKSEKSVDDTTGTYLVVAEKVKYNIEEPVMFIYSQKHILEQVIPNILAERDKLLITADTATAQKIANATGRPQYFTSKTKDEIGFGQIEYSVAYPDGFQEPWEDEVNNYNKRALKWVNTIGINEEQKIKAIKKGIAFQSYDLSSSAKIVHSAQDEAYGSDDSSNIIDNVLFDGWNTILKPTKDLIQQKLKQSAIEPDSMKTSSIDSTGLKKIREIIDRLSSSDNSKQATEIETPTSKIEWSFTPNFDGEWTDDMTDNMIHQRKKGFTLSTADDGYMVVDVYHTPLDSFLLDTTVSKIALNAVDGNLSSIKDSYLYNYVYYVRAGATRSPYEVADSTLFTELNGKPFPLGVATLKIDNPKILIEDPIRSNVPQDDKTNFKIVLYNDSELNPEVGKNYKASSFTLGQSTKTNSDNVKILCDGVPLSDGVKVSLAPGEKVVKTIEVERGTSFKIENLGITLSSNEDGRTSDKGFISITYVNSASPITLDEPRDKWVMNTNSSKDSIGFYLPISVSGFKVDHEGFDHIEIQYKETNKGEDNWVCICSYYNDSTLFKEASGVKELINSGTIRNARFYGAKDPTEMAYDIRAVSFSRFGNSFITRSSEVASGIKDTRCPKVFGLPEPANGTLTFSNTIKLPFTEPIAYNILDETANFSILGYKASSSLSQSSALKFSGQETQMAKSVVARNLVDRDFTIDMMVMTDKDNTDMTFFSHGEEENGGLSFGIDSEQRFTATINGQTIKSKALDYGLSGALTRVGMIYNNDNNTVEFFAGNERYAADSSITLNSSYKGQGPIYLGTDYTKPGEKLFSGSMLDVRVWAKALDDEELTAYKNTLSNGYEHMLVAHYPLTETRGSSAIDVAHGADLELNNTLWASKQGHALRTNAKPVLLDESYLAKSKTADFTLSFWYKSEKPVAQNTNKDTLAIFTAGRAALSDSNGLFIGYIGEKLTVRTNGTSYSLGEAYSDENWHQFTMTVNRSNNISRCYVDGAYVSQIPASAVNGIASDYIALGNDKSNFYFDEFAMWKLALPDGYIERYYNAVVDATDTELLVYLPFETDGESDQGQVRNVFSIYNEKRDYDSNVELYAKKTPILLNATEKNNEKGLWAPVAEKAALSKLDFTWSYSDNALLIKLLEDDAEINDQMIYITVRNVEDQNGNVMQNPAMWSVHTNLNQLSLEEYEIVVHAKCSDYNENGEYGEFNVNMLNKSGSYRNYKITTSADWLVPEISKGIALPEISETLRFHIKGSIDPGNYVGIIYLEDENKLVSTCIVNLEVRGDKPEYEVDNKEFDYSMVYKGLVKLKTSTGAEIIDNNAEDVVYAFIDGKCVGKSNIQVTDKGAYVYMTINGTKTNKAKRSEVTFKVWHERSSKLLEMVSSSAPVIFTQDGVVGASKPDTLRVSDNVIRSIQLKKGWNWVSLNVKPSSSKNPVADIFANNIKSFSSSDMFKSPTKFHQFSADSKMWKGNIVKLGNDTIYQIKVENAGTYCLSGEALTADDLKLNLQGGRWEPLPYLLEESQPINTALNSLQLGDDVNVGDVVKGLTEFAMFSENHMWEGNLTHMRTGEGYYINLQKEGKHQVQYTKAENGSNSLKSATFNNAVSADNGTVEYANNMPVIAQFGEDVDFEESDKLVAYSNGKKLNEAELQTVSGKKLFLLSVNAEQGSQITFAQERNGNVIANTSVPVKYDADNILGSLTAPYLITFTNDFVEVEPTAFTEEVLFRFHANEKQAATIDVYNTEGVCVWKAQVNTQEQASVNMNGSNLASGVYFATIKMGEMTKTIKLIKK